MTTDDAEGSYWCDIDNIYSLTLTDGVHFATHIETNNQTRFLTPTPFPLCTAGILIPPLLTIYDTYQPSHHPRTITDSPRYSR